MHTGVEKGTPLYRALLGEDPFPGNKVVDSTKNIQTALGGPQGSAGKFYTYPYCRIKEIISSGEQAGQNTDDLLSGLFAAIKLARGKMPLTPPIFEDILLTALNHAMGQEWETTLPQLEALVQW